MRVYPCISRAAALVLMLSAAAACGGGSAAGKGNASAPGKSSDGQPNEQAGEKGEAWEGASSRPFARKHPAASSDQPPEATARPAATAGWPKEPSSRPVPEDEGLSAPVGPAIVTLPGFRMLPDGGSVVFLEVSGRVHVVESRAEGRLSYHLAGAQVPERTNRLDIPTDAFATPVGHVQLLAEPGGADLIIELRAPTTPTARVQDSARGIVLRIEFPKPEGVRVPEQAVISEEPEGASGEP